MVLKSLHLLADKARLEHGDCGLLEGSVGSTIEIRTARADAYNELAGIS